VVAKNEAVDHTLKATENEDVVKDFLEILRYFPLQLTLLAFQVNDENLEQE